MLWILLAAIVLVHLDLHYRVWIARREDVFEKYRRPETPPLTAAKWAYLAKAVWLVGLILLQAAGIGFRAALVASFAAYAALIQVLLPFRVYNLLNAVLAMACLAEWWITGDPG
jgi:hypothetical protein